MSDLVTTCLEVMAGLLLAAAAALEISTWTVAGAVAIGGVVLLAEAAFFDWRNKPLPPNTREVTTA